MVEGVQQGPVLVGTFFTCIVMDTTAFDVCIGMNLRRENPEVIVGIRFTPSQLIVRTRRPRMWTPYRLRSLRGEPLQIMRSMY